MEEKTIDSKYIVQHLANERTFLAWVRTAIAIVGIGVLITNMHFTLRDYISQFADVAAIVIGVFSIFLGIVTIGYSSINYLQKRNAINSETFQAPSQMITAIALFILILCIAIASYFVLI